MNIDSGRSSGKVDSSPDKLSENQRQANFKRQHKEYIAMKLARKQQILRLRKEEFGSSSSDEDSDPQVKPTSPNAKKIQTPSSHKTPPKQAKNIPQELTEKLPVRVLSGKKGTKGSEEILQLKEGSLLTFSTLSYQIKAIQKIKLITDPHEKINKIKITNTNGNEVIFAVSAHEKKIGLPLDYYLFAKIIQDKLNMFGVKLTDNIDEKIAGLPESITSKAFKVGRILKKSQVWGKWEERLIIINEKGLFSYKKQTQKHTMFIGRFTIDETWTRFELEKNFLVVKVKYGQTKTQFGLPLSDFLSLQSWLYHLCGLLVKVE